MKTPVRIEQPRSTFLPTARVRRRGPQDVLGAHRKPLHAQQPGHDFGDVRVHAPTVTRHTAQVQRAPADAGTPVTGAGTAAACALTTYKGSHFVGETVTADVDFVNSLDAINSHAAANSVDVHVTSSFRTSTVVPGAVVTPAKMSNHLAGHAIDMNVMHGAKKTALCTSTCLGGKLPADVKPFIDAIRADAGLRWGGDFSAKDPVHIDDGLNVNDPAGYKKRHEATQKARASGCG